MPTQTFTLPEPPKIPSGKEIYDALMSQIEPELMSDSLPTLEEKYQSETPEQKEERRVRYNKAFTEYDKRYQTFTVELSAQVQKYERAAMRSLEQWSRSQEQRRMDTLFA